MKNRKPTQRSQSLISKTIQRIKTASLQKYLTTKTIIFLVVSLLSISIILAIFNSRRQNENTLTSNYTNLKFTTNGIPHIETGHYALWGIRNNTKIILKRFNYLNENLISLNLQPLEEMNIEGNHIYENYEISIEMAGDRDEIQSPCVLLKGNIVDDQIEFKLADADIQKFSGTFQLATFTDGTSNTNESSGVWFGENIHSNTPKPSLNLPKAPSCFNWAGFIFYRDKYLRIGSFKEPNSKDDFNEYSDFTRTPIDIPGEDYLKNIPFDLTPPFNLAQDGSKVIIALEPDPTFFRLYLDYRPFWEVMEYNFDGTESPNNQYGLSTIQQKNLTIKIRFTDVQ